MAILRMTVPARSAGALTGAPSSAENDEDKLVGQDGPAGAGQDESGLFEVVDPKLIGRDEHVGGRAFPDLEGERAGPAEVESHGVAGGPCVNRRDLAEGIGQACRRKDGQLGGLGGGRQGCGGERR